MLTVEQIHANAARPVEPEPAPEAETADTISARIPAPLRKRDSRGNLFPVAVATEGAAAVRGR